MLALHLVVSKTFRLLSKAAEHFTFLSTGYEGSTFSIFLSTLVIVCLFFFFDYCSHASEWEVVSHCGFNLPFPDD